MVPKSVIDVSIIWLNDDIYSRNTWFPTTNVQTQNIGKLRYANRRTPTECRHTVATQATEYQRWRDVGCRSRRCRPMPTLGQCRNASWALRPFKMLQIETNCRTDQATLPCLMIHWMLQLFLAYNVVSQWQSASEWACLVALLEFGAIPSSLHEMCQPCSADVEMYRAQANK